MKNKKRNILIIAIVIMVVVAVCAVFVYIYFTTHKHDKGHATIELSTSVNTIYLGGTGKINAVLRYSGDGSIEEGDFKFGSDHSELLDFTKKDGKYTGEYTIKPKYNNEPFENTVVIITVSCLDNDDIDDNRIEILVTDAIDLPIRFYKNKGDIEPTKTINIYQGYSIAQTNLIQDINLEIPNYSPSNDFDLEWYNKSTDERIIFDQNSVFYGITDLQIYPRYRLNKNLVLKDELEIENSRELNSYEHEIYYGEPISSELKNELQKAIQPYADWEFKGWYPDIDKEELQNGLDNDGNFYARTNTLYAKWSAKIPVALLLESNITQQEPIEVIYNGRIVGLPEPNYKVKYPDGTFKGFALSLNSDTNDQNILKLEKINDGQGIEQFLIDESTIYTYKSVKNAMFFACIEFELTVDYQCADNINGGKNNYSVIFNRPINESIGRFSRPEKINWEFNGYYQQPYAKGMQFTDETAYIISNNTTIYASWKQDISLKANINNIEDVNLTLIYGEPIDLSYYTYGKQGSWKFDGWYTKEFGVGQHLNKITRIELGKEGDQNQKEQQYGEILNKDDSGALYAKWVANEIVLYKNGGTVVNGIDTNLKEIIYGVSLGVQGKALPSLEREGYTFDKWLLPNGEEFNTMAPITILQLPALSACWEGKNVTVHLTSEGSGEVEITATMGEDMPVASIPPKPDSRNFNGYYYQAFGSDEKKYYYTADMESKRPWDIWSEEPVTLKADWITGLAVEWELGNGTDSLIKVVNSYTRASDIAPQKPTKTQDAQYSYTFVGWNTNPLATVGLVLEDQYITESTKFYAIYSKKLRTYNVNWYNSTGSLLESDSNVEYGSHPDFNSSNPTKSQDNAYIYTFSGWNIDKDASSTLNIQDYTIVGDVDFYPIFNSSKRKYTITVSTTSAKVYLNDVEYDDGNTIDVEWDTNIKFSHKDSENTCDGYSITRDDGTAISLTDGSFTMPQCNVTIWAKSHHKDGCVKTGTLVMLPDGTSVPIENLKKGDIILAWDFRLQKWVETPITLLVYHGESMYETLELTYSDGSRLTVIGEHEFFDVTLNRYVEIDIHNYFNFVGHEFLSYHENTYSRLKLINAVRKVEYTGSYTIVSGYYYNCITENIVSATPNIPGIYELVSSYLNADLEFDDQQFQKDIIKYGLYEYDLFAEYISYEQYIELCGAYFSIAVGKGYTTFEEIYYLMMTFSYVYD